jgi:tetratricopeptide (TPR) repeat protein
VSDWQEEWQGLVDEGLAAADASDYEGAVRALQAALERANAAQDDERRAMSLNNLAGVLYESGQVAAAEPLLREAFGVTQRLRGPSDPFTARAHANLAMVAEALHRVEEAESQYREALRILEAPTQRDTAEVATGTAETLYNLADLYRAQGRDAEARPLLERAVRHLERVWGPFHDDVAAMQQELAQTLLALEDFDGAVAALRKLADIRRTLLGEDHPDVAHVLNDLGVLRFRQGDLAEAERLYLEALHIRQLMLGTGHAAVATCENNLGGLYLHQGRHDEAVRHFARALAIWEPSVGLGDPEVAMALTNQGRAFARAGQTEEAARAYERSLRAWVGILGEGHAGLRGPAGEWAAVLREAGRADEAKAVAERFGG